MLRYTLVHIGKTTEVPESGSVVPPGNYMCLWRKLEERQRVILSGEAASLEREAQFTRTQIESEGNRSEEGKRLRNQVL